MASRSRSRSRSGTRLTKAQKESRQKLKTIGKWSLIILGSYELYMVLVDRRQKRRDAFNAALNAKAATNKPMLVIGDPDGSFVNRMMGADFDCQDLCIDPKGCPKCKNVLVADPLVALEGLGDNSHVVFVNAGYLEAAAYPDQLIAQIKRVSGGDAFFAYRQPWTLTAFSPWMKQRVKTAPPITSYVQWSKLPWGKAESGQLALKGFSRGGY